MRIRNSFVIVTLFVAGALGAMARAGTITATVTGIDPFVAGSVELTGAGTVSDSAVADTLWQGVASNSVPFEGGFNTYCIDVIEKISIGGTYTYTEEPVEDAPKATAYPTGTPTTGMGMTKADELEALFGVDYANTLPAANYLDREAFQLAIWNIVYDSDASVTEGAGSFSAIADTGIDPGAIPLANTFLADALNPANQVHDMKNLIALVGENGAQDQIAMMPVPAPATGKAAALLIAACAGYCWRRSRRLEQ
jgi:hypothetical protein